MIYFEDEEIIIRDIIEEDVVSLFYWWTDKELNLHDPRPLPSNCIELMKECESFCKRFESEVINADIAQRKYKYFIITDSLGTAIGFVNFFSIIKEKKQGEMGVIIGDRRYWKKGIAFKAVNEVTNYIFSNMNIDRIYIETAETNLPARRLFSKLGFIKCDEYFDDSFKIIVLDKSRV